MAKVSALWGVTAPVTSGRLAVRCISLSMSRSTKAIPAPSTKAIPAPSTRSTTELVTRTSPAAARGTEAVIARMVKATSFDMANRISSTLAEHPQPYSLSRCLGCARRGKRTFRSATPGTSKAISPASKPQLACRRLRPPHRIHTMGSPFEQRPGHQHPGLTWPCPWCSADPASRGPELDHCVDEAVADLLDAVHKI